jgi:ATP synthase F1 delta subunit
MEEIAEVYARSLFEVARESGSLDRVREQLGQVADTLNGDRDLQVFFFSPYFSTDEKKAGLERALEDVDPTVGNFLALLIEKHRMPAVFRIRTRFDQLWQEENKVLPVQITSAVQLDESPSAPSATASARRPAARSSSTARSTQTSSAASSCRSATTCWTRPSATASRTSASKSQGAPPDMQIKPDEITSILKSRIQGLDDQSAELTEVGTVLSVADGIARVHGLENAQSFEMLSFPHDVTGLDAEPRVRQRRRRAVRRVGEDRRGRHGQAHRPACSRSPSATPCWAASSTRSAARSTARATSRRPRCARPSSRPRASSSASRSPSRCRPA